MKMRDDDIVVMQLMTKHQLYTRYSVEELIQAMADIENKINLQARIKNRCRLHARIKNAIWRKRNE